MSESTPNTDITNQNVDKKFFQKIFQIVIAFLINIILGSYIVYISKILYVIELPTCMNTFPYITNYADDDIIDSKTGSVDIGINYLLSANKDDVDKIWSFREDCDRYYTKIGVDKKDYTEIYNPWFFKAKELYTSSWVTIAVFLTTYQRFLCFSYWGICLFFSKVYGNTFLWESVMTIFGFPLFIAFISFWALIAPFYVFFTLLYNIYLLWYYDSGKNNQPIEFVTTKNLKEMGFSEKFKKTSGICWRWTCSFFISLFFIVFAFVGVLPFSILYSFGCLPFLIAIVINIARITCHIVDPLDPTVTVSSEKDKPWSLPIVLAIGFGFIFLFFIFVYVPTLSIYTPILGLIIILLYAYISKKNNKTYSTLNILLSKIEIITYFITFIFIAYSSYYGSNIMIAIVVIFIALWCTRGKHKLLYYPYDAKESPSIFTLLTNRYESSPADKADCNKVCETIPFYARAAESEKYQNIKNERDINAYEKISKDLITNLEHIKNITENMGVHYRSYTDKFFGINKKSSSSSSSSS